MKVTWKLRPIPGGGGWEGEVILPPDGPGAPVRVATLAPRKREAIARAAVAARAIATNPVLAAVLPPGTAAAVRALSALARSPTTRTLRRYAGPGARRLVSALRSL